MYLCGVMLPVWTVQENPWFKPHFCKKWTPPPQKAIGIFFIQFILLDKEFLIKLEKKRNYILVLGKVIFGFCLGTSQLDTISFLFHVILGAVQKSICKNSSLYFSYFIPEMNKSIDDFVNPISTRTAHNCYLFLKFSAI